MPAIVATADEVAALAAKLDALAARVAAIEVSPEPQPEPEPDPIPDPEFPAASPLRRMVEERHSLGVLLLKNADRAAVGSPVYGDSGQYGVLAYKATGDATYARSAWSLLLPAIGRLAAGNSIRESLLEYTVCLHEIRAALSADELAEGVAALDRAANIALGIGQPAYKGGFSVADSDQLVGQYFGLAAIDKLFGRDYLSQTTGATGVPNIAIGGLVPTGTGTVRDTLARYADLASGGVWIESSQYNIGTLSLLLLGVQTVGPEHFPEFDTEFWRRVAYAQIAEITPDLEDCFQWGDCEGRGIYFRLFYRLNLLWMLGGVLGDLPEGRWCRWMATELSAKHGVDPWWRAYWFIDPYQAIKEPPAEMSVDSAMGIYLRKTTDELFAVTFPAYTGVHHQIERFGDFALYRHGKWVVDRPVGYGGNFAQQQTGNCLLLCGLGPMAARGSFVDADRLHGWTYGPYYHEGYYSSPPGFVKSYQRIIYRDGLDIVITDDVDGFVDPRTQPKFDRYRAADQTRMKDALPVSLVLHPNAPVEVDQSQPIVTRIEVAE